MASFITRAVLQSQRNIQSILPKRNIAYYTKTGGVVEKPDQVKFPMTKIMLVLGPFTYCGIALAKNGAAFLEENDIFVPEDDDD